MFITSPWVVEPTLETPLICPAPLPAVKRTTRKRKCTSPAAASSADTTTPPPKRRKAGRPSPAPSPSASPEVPILTREELAPYIRELDLEGALKQRDFRISSGLLPKPRSRQKQLADARRTEKKNNGTRPRKKKIFRCPDPECNDPTWTCAREFKSHLGVHHIAMFECRECDADFSRRDNLVVHLRTLQEHAELRKMIVSRRNGSAYADADLDVYCVPAGQSRRHGPNGCRALCRQ
ncbi:hypothetical protein ABW21_db0202004 [Orbilia brochopaga]|nr:hypothetical protein ABW21_db0202004 [Drechslerella brochopaga]